MLRPAGLHHGVNIGPGFRNTGKPQASDFDRLQALPFRHLLSDHGEPLLNEAHAAVSIAMAPLRA